MSKTVVTANEVRAYFRESPKARMSKLSPEAQATVVEGARGRLHPQAIKLHNSRRKTRMYVAGATAAAKAAKAAQREELAKAGVSVGKRGPLSKAAKAALSK